MITTVVLPQLSLSMRTGIVTRWYKAEGDYVQQGEPICTIEGDKATIDVEAPVEGYLTKIVAREGEEFPVKQAMAYIGDRKEAVQVSGALANDQSTLAPPAPDSGTPSQQAASSGRVEGRVKASPVAKRLAAELGVDLSTIVGTGPDGLIGREDVLAAKAAASAKPEARPASANAAANAAANAVASAATLHVEREFSPTGIKKLVAERMKESYLDAPHIHLSLTCVMTETLRYREELNQKLQGQNHVTVTDLILWAAGRAIQKHKLLNSTYKDSRIITYAEVNIGLAVAGEKGLVVPVIREVDRLSLLQIAEMRQALAEKVKNDRQTMEDLSGGTFTLTNLGMFGIEVFDPILTPGQAGILAAGKVKLETTVDEKGRIAVEPTMALTLACDHRVADGIDGAKFLSDLKDLIEKPEEMFKGLL